MAANDLSSSQDLQSVRHKIESPQARHKGNWSCGIGFNYTKVLFAVLFYPLQLDTFLNQELEIYFSLK